MAVSRVGSSTTSNNSSSTSVTVNVPSGVQDGDAMFAVVGRLNQDTITAPTGWELIGTRDAGSHVRIATYFRWASTEPANYRWTFVSGYKNYGGIVAYRGVDTTSPYTASSGTSPSGTSHTSPAVTAVTGDWLLTAVCSRHNVSGSATTWTNATGTDSELYDNGSNTGSGVDISGAIYDSNTTVSAGSVSRTLTSSQTESQNGLWSVLIHAAAESGGEFDSGSTTTNGTAGTTCVVTKPSGTADGDLLVAVINENGTSDITAPSGWKLLDSATAGSNLKSAIYWKIAASEGANWTWTFGSSVRNWGWAANYTGADTSDPLHVRSAVFETGTSYTTPQAEVLDASRWLGVISAVRTATGAATTWTGSGSERADTSTNGVTGIDIGGAVYESASLSKRFSVTITASQEQGYAVLWSLAILEPFTRPTFPLNVKVKAAFGANPDADPSTWTFTDITDSVWYPAGLSYSYGKPNAVSFANPAEVSFTLKNPSGHFTPGNASSTHYPYVVRNVPIQVSIDDVGVNPPYQQITCFVDSWTPRWDTTTDNAFVAVKASGRLRRLQQGSRPLRSALYRTITGRITPYAYWPAEDGSQAGYIANALPSGPNMGVGGTVTLAADSTLGGSLPVPTLANGSKISVTLDPYTTTGQWAVAFAMKAPSSVGSATVVATITTTGTLRTWQIRLVNGTPDTLQVRALNSAGTQVFVDSVSVVDESEFYGSWNLVHLGVRTNDTDVDYTLSFFGTNSGSVTGTETADTHGNIRTLNIQAVSATDGIAVGHIGVWTDPAFDIDADPQTLSAALDGHAGETPADRFTRLCGEEGIPYEVIDASSPSTDITMGPQPADSFVAIMRECESLDGGVVHDGGLNGALVMVTRASRYNAFPTMTLDIPSGQVGPDFSPEYDDQQIRNDVTVSRDGGASARFEDPANIALEGRYPEEVTLNVNGDASLPEIAGWRVNLGTVPGMRYPKLSWNLRATPSIARDAMTCRVGSRLAVPDVPSDAPDVDVFAEGFSVNLDHLHWDVTANCSPADPYDVAVLEAADGSALRLDTDGSELAADITSAATTFDVISTGEDVWTVDTDDFPLDVEIDGEQIRLSAIATDAVTLVNAGTAASDGNASGTATLSPALPASLAAGDLLLLLACIRNSGTGTVVTPSGYSVLVDHSNFKLFGKYATSTESAPTVSFSDGVANATVVAQTAAFRSATLELVTSATTTNGSAANISYPALGVPEDNCLIVYVGWRGEDWTSVTSPGTEIGEPDSASGDGTGIVWAYQVQTTRTDIASGSFTVTGGVSASGKGAVAALRPTQTFTASARSVNNVTKSHSAGASVRVWEPHVLAL